MEAFVCEDVKLYDNGAMMASGGGRTILGGFDAVEGISVSLVDGRAGTVSEKALETIYAKIRSKYGLRSG